MPLSLHIIEPTLTGTAGHCHALVRSLALAAPECEVTVWAGKGTALASEWTGPANLQTHFSRLLRRPQAYWLYRRLLRQPGRILVSTAGSADLVLADWAARGRIAPKKLFLFAHWLNAKRSKARMLAAIARRQPHIEILAPTAVVADSFASFGFRSTVVPYPLEPLNDGPGMEPPGFRYLLVAGGARLDKGFDKIVDLIVELKQRGMHVPIVVQTSIESRHQDDLALAQQLARLRAVQYPHLSLREESMSPEAYRALFRGAIVLQPYRADDFRDRVSGVTLDALAAAAPVVVTDHTWMASLVRRFNAGEVIEDLSASGMLAAIERVQSAHAHYAARAVVAASSVRAEHSARRLIDVVLQPN